MSSAKSIYDIDIRLTDFEAALRALDGAQSDVKRATVPAIAEMAKVLQARAISGVVFHPSGLFSTGKRGRSITPNYRTKKTSDFWWVVETPGTAAGKAEAIAEFAAQGITSQGAAMVRALTGSYGRSGGPGGGRVLYKARDELDGEFAAMLEDAVAKAESMIERKI